METNQTTMTIETASNPALAALQLDIQARNPQTRADAARIVQSHGYSAYVGGRHVAVLPFRCFGTPERMAIITNAAAADWN
jgi:hypothetical protein